MGGSRRRVAGMPLVDGRGLLLHLHEVRRVALRLLLRRTLELLHHGQGTGWQGLRLGVRSFEFWSRLGHHGLLGRHLLRMNLLVLGGWLLGGHLVLLHPWLLLLEDDGGQLDVVLVVILPVDHGGVRGDKVSAVVGSWDGIILLLFGVQVLGLLRLWWRGWLLPLVLDSSELILDMSCLLGLSIQLRLLVIEVNQPLLFVNSALHFLKLISVLISRQISIKVISDLLRLVVDRVVVATHVVLFQV